MRILVILFWVASTVTMAQEKTYLYPSNQKVTNDGYDKDKEPPYVQYFKSETPKGYAILICPGGGYTTLADQHEGIDVARFFNSQGYDAFILHYRLNSSDQKGHRFPDQFNDVTRAIRIVKSKGKELKYDPEKVGIIGFSAGGHLASMCATMLQPANKTATDPLEQWSSRPAYAVLIYPVIDFSSSIAHAFSREMLLGKDPDPKMVELLSTQNRVYDQTPPTFLVYSNDDKSVVPENGILFYQALRKNNIHTSLHIYDRGGHGFGLGTNDPVLSTWPKLCIEWMKGLGFGK